MSLKNNHKLLVFSALILLSVVFSVSGVLAANCWSANTNSTCSAVSGCLWVSDSWSSYCTELSCSSLGSQTSCTGTSLEDKNCTWNQGGTNFYCETIGCYTYSGTSQTACENNPQGLACGWQGSCYPSGSGGGGGSCWNLGTQSTCLNATGCSWGQCNTKSCSDYSTSSSCNAAIQPWGNKNCTWSGSSCTSNSCSNKYSQSTCESASGINCIWSSSGWCYERGCSDFKNQSSCQASNTTHEIDCVWDGSWCSSDSCWRYDDTQAQCNSKSGCTWNNWTSNGWCEELRCWNWDWWRGGGESACNGNASFYGLDCIWRNQTVSNGSEGWCEQNYGAINCANITTENKCRDTFYCWWNANNWNDPTAGGNCTEPDWASSGSSNGIINEWNPGCFIFDNNETKCNDVIGCTYSGGNCDEAGNAQGTNITSNGISCNYINDSNLCQSVAVLSTCCAWSNGTCGANRATTSCWDNLDKTPAGESSCEDATSKSNCDSLAADPWYWPCTWDNTTSVAKCSVKKTDIWGNRTQSLVTIENKQTCEAVGGRWVTESYCEAIGSNSVSVPAGRCEYKFDEERNCNKACFACEYKSDGTVHNSSDTAKSACFNSALGTCEFKANGNAPNGYGYCEAKDQFKGVVGDCDSSCGACTFLGDSLGNSTKTPKEFCEDSNANGNAGGCKWIVDNTTNTQGYCLEKDSKTCVDGCDRCYTQSTCSNNGRLAIANQSGSCKWQGTENDGTCVANIGEDVEICWNGEDDDEDALIDCADPACFSDSFCGLIEGDCFTWEDNNSCAANSCEWVVDKWGSWCDFKGSQCWKSDKNESVCYGNNNCKWENGTGSGSCERDWSIAEACYGLSNASNCFAVSNCVWTNDTWCDGGGAGSDWCSNYGGWCDHESFKPADCWQNYDNSSCSGDVQCNWRTSEWSNPYCEVNWSANCGQYNTQSTCGANGCYWDSEWNWCGNTMEECWRTNTQSACNAVSGNKCSWNSWSNNCEPSCFSNSLKSNQTACSAVSGCVWKADNGWCEEKQADTCYNSTNSGSQSNCEADSTCRWRDSGWCSPKDGFSASSVGAGGGVGGAVGGDCYKYDNNKTLCLDKSTINASCGWTDNANPYCSANWAADCWKYTTSGTCSSNGCWWNPDSSWCGNLADQCWNNFTLTSDATACNANQYCNATASGCEATCFSQTTENACGTIPNTACRWNVGWCNALGIAGVFDEMEGGAPVILTIDTLGDASQASVDMLGVGVKDMGDAYGFGARVVDFSNSSVCNKETTYVGESITSITGAGNETVKFVVYLDTDGTTTGGCSLLHDSSATGYEFRLRYASEWNNDKGKASETFATYKCDNSKWKLTDIKMSAWKKAMCSDARGPMVGIDKGELDRFPTLYDSTKDLRVYASTIGNTGNVSSPSDTAGPGWLTPGAIDFEVSSAFNYGADSSKFEDILRTGFVQYEDCFNSVDDDGDSDTDCADWDCQFSPKCTSTGVNAAGYNDTSMPKVTGVKIEEYTDGALIFYDTSKPANGTLEFYKTDSTCTTLNKTLDDIGITSSAVRDYKLWHSAEIYDSKLGYALTNDTNYYYKLNICDNDGKCAKSKCTSFVTAPVGKCGYCDFVTRIKTSSSWTVSYDVNQDGTYEHIQGQVCGSNAGMKSNYTDGRRVNLKLEKSDSSTYFEFINASITKTGLNDKVRSISSSGDIIGTTNYVGLTSDTRDKIINNLHPEVCRIKIPTDGTCTTLYHCDDSGENCIDRTSEATLLDSSNCVWQVPYCEFSTYRVETTTSDSGSGNGGGGGGGGGAAKNFSTTTPKTTTPTTPEDSGEEKTTGEKIEEFFQKEDIKKGVFWTIIGILVIAGIVGVAAWIHSRHHAFDKIRKAIKIKGKNMSVK